MKSNANVKYSNSGSETLRIVIVSGRHEGAELEIQLPLSKNILIGSHQDCDLVISDEGVANLHAMIFEQAGTLQITALPGCGEMLLDEHPVLNQAMLLTSNMLLKLGGHALLQFSAGSLPQAKLARHEDIEILKKSCLRLRKTRVFAATFCVTCGVVLVALSLGAINPARALMAPSLATGKSASTVNTSVRHDPLTSLKSAAQQVDRYLADPGVKVTARLPNRIEIAGAARSAATKGQLEKLQKALPVGVEIFSTVSYPEDKVGKIGLSTQDQKISMLAKKITQVAGSERAPYVEIDGGTRIFEGGQLNGYELLKITSSLIVAKRDNQVETFKVE